MRWSRARPLLSHSHCAEEAAGLSIQLYRVKRSTQWSQRDTLIRLQSLHAFNLIYFGFLVRSLLAVADKRDTPQLRPIAGACEHYVLVQHVRHLGHEGYVRHGAPRRQALDVADLLMVLNQACAAACSV
jgi:hypothetical protein